ncbi:chorismate synthase [Pullulanibacillus pueri]|uniref:Chorismate synthase n=1 Tax=Pullulanibacillus pueri TaxID=1437324 RepID=A0A8J2ZVA7_9BACL|nr:chorismate synthase [Pullulanibacillus pueri]MBM7681462.1 chorismate synthase [Pullulanibacillus pueri]GGH78974.1 chorismate synthase 1 [Pullulanibacillus pueri]
MRFLTAGESHGPQLTIIIEGFPAGLEVKADAINEELRRRQGGYGRGRRMKIEKDTVQIVGGIRHGYTTGAPIALVIENKDWRNWTEIMGPDPIEDPSSVKKRVSRPRPGHADLNGAIKYGHRDMRDVLERSSARETAARVAVGTIAKLYLKAIGIEIAGRVVEICGAKDTSPLPESIEVIREKTEASEVRCLDQKAEEEMKKVIDEAKANGDSVGGVVETIVAGAPVGLGSHVHYDRKLDAKIAMAVMSINAFKGVEFGAGFEMASLPGSQVHDEIQWAEGQGYSRKTNRLGGFEGGMTTGMPIIVRGVMKPIPTLYKPLQSVDIQSKEPFSASIERTDNCAVPAASVVCEHMVAWELALAVKEKFGGDRMEEVIQAVKLHRERSVAF